MRISERVSIVGFLCCGPRGHTSLFEQSFTPETTRKKLRTTINIEARAAAFYRVNSTNYSFKIAQFYSEIPSDVTASKGRCLPMGIDFRFRPVSSSRVNIEVSDLARTLLKSLFAQNDKCTLSYQ